MGILDKIFRRGKKKGVGEGVRYILKRREASGGMVKVTELQEPVSIDDLYQSLAPGIYSLHSYRKGQTGFDVVWGPVEVLGEEPKERTAKVVRGSPFAGLREFAEEMKQVKEDITVAFETLGPMAGFEKPGESKSKTILEQLKEAKTEQRELNELFPSSTTKSADIPISGSIPAALVYAPQAIDQSMDAIEKRLRRWGLVEEEGVGAVGHREVIRMPEKPKRVMEKKAEVEPVKVESEVGTLKLSSKPEAKVGVKEINIKEEEKAEEEKEDDEQPKKSGK